MAKKKIQRFAENATFLHLIQPGNSYPPVPFELQGNWNTGFFKSGKSIILELGCGRGEYTVELARAFKEKNFIGIDWKGARLWRGAKTVQEEAISNAAFLRIQIQNITHYFGPGEVSEIWITFPDPQMQKTRERKRLTNPSFLAKYRQLLKPGGVIHLKTDNTDFYQYTLEVIKQEGLEIITSSSDIYHSHAGHTVLGIQTTYEKKFLLEGKPICYVSFRLQ